MEIDTDLAIQKFQKMVEAATPIFQETSQKFVEYTCMKAFILVYISIGVGVIGLTSLFVSYLICKFKNAKIWDDTDCYSVLATIFFTAGVGLTIGGIVAFFLNGYPAFLAYNCPEMYTLSQILTKQ